MKVARSKVSAIRGFLALFAGAIGLSVAMLWYRAWQDASDRISTAQAQIDRVQWIADHQEELKQGFHNVAADKDLAGGFIPGDSADQATAMLHRIVKRAIDASQSSILSAQPLPARQDGSATTITVRYQVSVTPDGLTRFLYDIETGRPYAFIDSIDITSQNSVLSADQSSPRLSLQIDIHGYFREAPHG